MDYVSAEIAEALTGVLPIPTVLALESELPDISQGATEVYYFVINNMNVSSPTLERQGRAWCGVGDTTWQKIVDTVNTLSSDSFQQKQDGSWIINEATQTLIDGAIQNSQITTLAPNSSSTDQEVPSAKSVYTGLEKRISKSSIDIIEPTSSSTDNTVPSSKLINSMMGGNLSSLTTGNKTVIGSLNELNQNKVNQSLDNLNEEGQNYINSLVSSQYITVGQLVPLMFPTNDAKLHLADGTLISQIGKYAQFSDYLKEIEEKYGAQMDLFCTQAEWDGILNTYGYCPKFVIDNVNQTIRLPLLKGYMKGVNNIVDLGKINEAGLPNIKGAMTPNGTYSGLRGTTASGAFGILNGSAGLMGEGNNNAIGFDFNASRSSSVYKDGLNTVEVDGYNCLVYIVLATGATQSISAIENYEVYNTVPLTCPIYSPNRFEDVNYLLSDNQFHSGAMYSAVWELLIKQYNNENSIEVTKTLNDGTFLTLKKTPLDYLICKIDGNNTEEKINRFYDEIKFTCWVLDTANNRFKLPQNTKKDSSNYLYFKVGNTTVNSESIDVGHLIVEVNNKANRDGSNADFGNLSDTAKENITTLVGLKKINEFNIEDGDAEVVITGIGQKETIIDIEGLYANSTPCGLDSLLGNSDSYYNTNYFISLMSIGNYTPTNWVTNSFGAKNTVNTLSNKEYNDWSINPTYPAKLHLKISKVVGNAIYVNGISRLITTDGNYNINFIINNALVQNNLNVDRIKIFLNGSTLKAGNVRIYQEL